MTIGKSLLEPMEIHFPREMEAKKRELTYLFISHDAGVIRWMCDELAVMEQGEFLEYGETERIFRKPGHAFTQNLLNTWYRGENLPFFR